jgi:hypothetical protein
MASLEILAAVLQATRAALATSHPCLEADPPCSAPLAPCRFADSLCYQIDELDNAILNYQALVVAALDSDNNDNPPS